jgi:hypothetical protein
MNKIQGVEILKYHLMNNAKDPKNEPVNGFCKICGCPIEEGETNSCTIAVNCLNTTIVQERAMKN